MENKIDSYKDMPEKIEFDSTFKEIFNLMENSKQNIFITGKAGAGKTTLLEYFRNNSKKKSHFLKLGANFSTPRLGISYDGARPTQELPMGSKVAPYRQRRRNSEHHLGTVVQLSGLVGHLGNA